MKIDEIIVVTGCDSGHFDLAEDFIVSFRKAYGDRYKTGFVKFDTQPLTNVLSSLFDIKVDCSSGFASFDPSSGYYAAFQRLKVRLPDLFPGFQTYCWIDSDCWFQDSQSIPRITKGANNCDICIHPEFDTH